MLYTQYQKFVTLNLTGKAEPGFDSDQPERYIMFDCNGQAGALMAPLTKSSFQEKMP